jgi:ATP-binding protein involved in chromosome partitioning
MSMFGKRKENEIVAENDVLKALSQVKDPDLHRDIVSLNFVQNLKIDGSVVSFDINLTTPACPVKEKLRDEARQVVMSLDGVTDVHVNLTAEVRQHAGLDRSALSGVRNIVAIGSGKGGVGKSTVATNLAVGLALTGARVGLLDADIYGPSIPIMMGMKQQAEFRGNRIIPLKNHNITFMSMGLFVPGDKPLIWRGPMAHKALQQCLFEVAWDELDYLIVDLPPGTGDVHLTLAQSVPVTGAVIVSTPQDVGLMISMKTLRMFQQVNVPILGIIENMSYHVCSHCGAREDIFGHGGAAKASEELGIPFLGEIPIDVKIREWADAGTPIIVADPDSSSAKAYQEILGNLAAQISIQNYQRVALEIVEVPA